MAATAEDQVGWKDRPGGCWVNCEQSGKRVEDVHVRWSTRLNVPSHLLGQSSMKSYFTKLTPFPTPISPVSLGNLAISADTSSALSACFNCFLNSVNEKPSAPALSRMRRLERARMSLAPGNTRT